MYSIYHSDTDRKWGKVNLLAEYSWFEYRASILQD